MWIGISGKAGVGKTTLAKKLCTYLAEYNPQIVPFAKRIKEIAAIAGATDRTSIMRANLLFAMLLLNKPEKTNDEEFLKYVEKLAGHMVYLGDQYPNKPNQKNRRLLQLIGTEFGRDAFGDDVWVNYVKQHLHRRPVTITDDIRFNNEADAVDFHIHIDHTVDPELYTIWSYNNNVINDHSSENSLTRIPDLIVPIGCPDTLIKTLADYLAKSLAGELL